jgi:hypothetical protein
VVGVRLTVVSCGEGDGTAEVLRHNAKASRGVCCVGSNYTKSA